MKFKHQFMDEATVMIYWLTDKIDGDRLSFPRQRIYSGHECRVMANFKIDSGRNIISIDNPKLISNPNGYAKKDIRDMLEMAVEELFPSASIHYFNDKGDL